MLCSNPQCSYTHWILHANYQLGHIDNVQSKEKDNIFAKRHLIMSKILTEYKKKKPSSENILKPKPDVDTIYQTGVRKTKYHSQESILIPKDPTSPYAFTINANKMQKKKKYFFNQVQYFSVWYRQYSLWTLLAIVTFTLSSSLNDSMVGHNTISQPGWGDDAVTSDDWQQSNEADLNIRVLHDKISSTSIKSANLLSFYRTRTRQNSNWVFGRCLVIWSQINCTKYWASEVFFDSWPWQKSVNQKRRESLKRWCWWLQACCVVAWFLAVCLVSILGLLLYLSLCTRAMTSGMTWHSHSVTCREN